MSGIRPFHLEGRDGALLATYYSPIGAPHAQGDVLLAPSFAEEMHRCRAMVSMQARAFARVGIGTLILDLYGTGDSAGEFSDASLTSWRDDLRRGMEWLRRSANGCRAVWGIRLGALMAAELACESPGIDHLLLWQPVVDGKTFFTQFLRIRIAAELEQSGGIKTTDELRRMSASGEIIEVSGYRINPQLARELDEIRLPDPSRLTSTRVSWCEVVPAADAVVPRASAKAVDAWRAAGVALAFERVIGPPFWQVHERAAAPELITATTRLIAAGSAATLLPAPRSGGDHIAAAVVTREHPVVFECEHEWLLGMLHAVGGNARRAVVIVVAGGPQYRAGAHRQFVSLARKLADRGFPVLRFDMRGMGDSSGEHLGFEHSKPDIRAAIDALIARQPGVEEVVLFGECESASGILFYAFDDPRVKGIALVNPWVRTEGGRAGVIMKHYYLNRLLSVDFWRKLRAGHFNPAESLRSFLDTGRAYLLGRKINRQGRTEGAESELARLPLPIGTAVGLARFRGPVMILMSGHDYIAREFDEVIRSSKAWDGLLENPRVCRRDLPGADHTFSREIWKRQASDWVCDWVGSW
jgi:exosortase A-associated hydrolase 1/exosortase A-associated hydrolase 2